MTAAAVDMDQLVRQLTRDVTYSSDPPYPELKTALETLICRIQGLDCDSKAVDWAAIVSEATSLRPHH